MSCIRKRIKIPNSIVDAINLYYAFSFLLAFISIDAVSDLIFQNDPSKKKKADGNHIKAGC